MRRRRPFCCLGIVLTTLVLAAGLFLHFGEALVRARIEREAASQLPKLIGPAESYTVKASVGLLALSRGTIDSLDIRGKNVELDGKTTLKSLRGQIENVRFDPGTRTVTGIGKTRFTAALGREEMNDYLSSRYPALDGSGVVLHDGYLTLAARPEIGDFALSLKADARLHILDSTRLVAEVTRVSAAGLGVPRVAGRYIEDKLNPILDSSEWGVNAKLDAVSITPDAVTLRGTASLKGLRRP